MPTMLTQGKWRPNTAECERCQTWLIACSQDDASPMGDYDGHLTDHEKMMLRRSVLCLEWALRRGEKSKFS